MLIPVIMAGGSGTRLWLLSRSLYTKQFLPLIEIEVQFGSYLSEDDIVRFEDLYGRA